jgi:glycosyltransferase involved in cell wall biosynthesis
MKVLFFLSHQPNPRYVKQLNFLAKNNEVSLIFFKRKTLTNLNSSLVSDVIRHDLGYTPDFSSPFKRIIIYLKAINKLKKIIKSQEIDLILLSNIDVLLLYVLSSFSVFKKNKDIKITIEIPDLREFVFGKSLKDKMMRKLERYLYKKKVDKLIVTSERYNTYHFKNFFNKETFILENKLLSNEIKIDANFSKKKSDKIVIGIIGMLLREKEYIRLFETYKNSKEIEIHIHGKGHYQALVKKYAEKYDNITYFGPYNAFTDSQRIFNSIDLVYLVYDASNPHSNNRLALPNKLYECMFFKVPILCSKNTYLEEIVLDYGIGIGIDYKEDNAIEQGVNYLIKNKKQINSKFNTIQEKAYFGDQDYKRFETFLKH